MIKSAISLTYETPMTTTPIQDRYHRASAETQRLIDRVLEQDADDHAWAEQVGPAYRQADVAELLGKSKQAVSADTGLLRLEMRNGRIGYPAFQFDGRVVVSGLREVVGLLSPVAATDWTVASWLTSSQPELDQQRPIDVLRAGVLEAVLAAARRAAAALAA